MINESDLYRLIPHNYTTLKTGKEVIVDKDRAVKFDNSGNIKVKFLSRWVPLNSRQMTL